MKANGVLFVKASIFDLNPIPMNRLFLLALLAASSLGNSFAQTSQPTKRLQVGLVAGKTILGTYQEEDPWQKVGGGFVGADFSYAFAKEDPNFTIRLQPNWESYRYESLGEFEVNGNGSYRATLNSLNVPVLIRLAIPAGKWVSPFVELGANYKIRVRGQVESRSVICGIIGCNEYVFEGDFMAKELRNDISLLAGVGAEFHWGDITIPVSVRINGGLGKYTFQSETVQSNSFSLVDLKTKTLQVVTGITL
ncbi:hypothetical protein GCM10007390_14680 [Persicitalea jodogahamensis]|uniref:Outer membrane protein beta-barrel domain-containing protein n=2 Tax=Persicitalea jodogahamensis TaxID=402147 RepID=A0A8J3G847_9BACT|nr:hypothetical protein GCM10007390_14680 [Persicitalea jodogahamensis]